jgi:hypothetical protein
MEDQSNDMLIITLLPDPELAGKHPDGVCWRCGGTGVVKMTADLTTPCGACFGITPAKPCPKCGSTHVKIRYDGSFCMYCRDCLHLGPYADGDLGAYELWQRSVGS